MPGELVALVDEHPQPPVLRGCEGISNEIRRSAKNGEDRRSQNSFEAEYVVDTNLVGTCRVHTLNLSAVCPLWLLLPATSRGGLRPGEASLGFCG
jgi:hypothetical protein